MPSLSCVTDAELLGHIDLVKEMYEQHLASKQPNGETFNSAQFTLLINAFPAPTRAAIKYMIVKLPGGDAIGQQLGMSKSEMNGLQRRFDKICSESLPAAMREAEVSILADLKRRGNLTDAAIARACSPRAQLERYRRIINQQHVRAHHLRLPTHASCCERATRAYPLEPARSSPLQPTSAFASHVMSRCCVTTGSSPHKSLRRFIRTCSTCCATRSVPTQPTCRSRPVAIHLWMQ